MSLIVTDTLQESRARVATSGQVSRAEIVSSQQVQDIRGRLIANLQAARSSSFIVLLNNQSNS